MSKKFEKCFVKYCASSRNSLDEIKNIYYQRKTLEGIVYYMFDHDGDVVLFILDDDDINTKIEWSFYALTDGPYVYYFFTDLLGRESEMMKPFVHDVLGLKMIHTGKAVNDIEFILSILYHNECFKKVDRHVPQKLKKRFPINLKALKDHIILNSI